MKTISNCHNGMSVAVASICCHFTAFIESRLGKIFTHNSGKKMYQSIAVVFLSTVIFLICVPEVFSIKCWVCRSDIDPKCTDPFDNSSFPITDCRQEPDLAHLPGVRPTMCRKIRQKVNGEWRYYRSCAYLGEPGIENDERFCLMRTGTYNIFLEYCTCNSKDGCNVAPGISVNLPLVLLSVASCLYGILHIFVLR